MLIEEDAKDRYPARVVDYERILEVAQIKLADLSVLASRDKLSLLVREMEVVYGRFVRHELLDDQLFLQVPDAARAVDRAGR